MVLVKHGNMSMVIDMNDEKLKTLEQTRESMAGTVMREYVHLRESGFPSTPTAGFSDVLFTALWGLDSNTSSRSPLIDLHSLQGILKKMDGPVWQHVS